MLLPEMASGFNISYSITLRPDFGELYGFTDEDVKAGLGFLNITNEMCNDLFDILKQQHDGYRFYAESKVNLFNPTGILHVLKETQFLAESTPPRQWSSLKAPRLLT